MKKYILTGLLCVIGFVLPVSSNAYTVYLNEFTGSDARVKIDITGDGTTSITFDVTVLSPLGDIRGVWFDLDPFTTAFSFTDIGDITDTEVDEDSVGNLGNGANLNGNGGSYGNFDVGVVIGTSGIGNDDFLTTSFTIGSTNSSIITLGNRFGVRLTSVGTNDSNRNGSSKLAGYYVPSEMAVPEPSTFLLLGAGLLGIAGVRRRV